MDELPELLVEAVEDETVIETIDIGGGDVLTVTPSKTNLYRSEGLLSDESIQTFTHDVDRFGVDTGRRKSSILLDSVDQDLEFAIPSGVVDVVVEAILEGILRTTGVVAAEETVEAQFRFSDLTLVVTDQQLLKHIGTAVWNDEYEAIYYDDLTGLSFEQGSVATQVVLKVAGRQQRVKVPNDHAGRVREEIQSAIFEFHDVSSLGGLHSVIDPEADDEKSTTETAQSDITDDSTADESDDGFVSADWSPPADQDITSDSSRTASMDDSQSDDETVSAFNSATANGDADGQAVAEQVEALTEQLRYQTELLESQQETIELLVEELRRGR